MPSLLPLASVFPPGLNATESTATLRTSILERVNGELAGLLTGDSGGERMLQDLEQANAFVVALDAGRSWFRYHRIIRRRPGRRRPPGMQTILDNSLTAWLTRLKQKAESSARDG